MSEHEARGAEAALAKFFAEDGLADRDPVFSATIVEGIAKRRLRARLAELAGVAGLAVLLLWAVWQAAAPEILAMVSGLGPVALAGVVLGSIYVGLRPLLQRA